MLKLRRFLIALFAVTVSTAHAAAQFYVKEVTFPEGATLEEKVEIASRVVPTPKQREWQNLEMTAFLHFGINTFTDREWGDGKESPALFNPANLDVDQWVKTLKDAGFRMVILTAKHHDGFCLWPTATTSHSVKSSPWKVGNGDVMAELRKACDTYDMKLGVYLSPWDRNAACYGDSPAYNDMFVAQLTELLTNYGKIDEVWFDGACGEGPNGKKQEYDWARYKNTIETLQPDAVVAIMGDDVRWVGNEKGVGRETEWSVTAITPGILPDAEASNKRLGIFPKAPDLGGRDLIDKAEKLYWWPSEVDVSIRPGWFWHAKESPKSLRKLAEIYLQSVGRNSVLLLNVPPSTEGVISAADSIRLMQLKEWIDVNFSNNIAQKGDILAGIALNGSEPFNTVVLCEDISQGQRVENFEVMVKNDHGWNKAAHGTTIGNKRILTFPETIADSLKVDIVSSRGPVYLNTAQVYNIVLPEEEYTSRDFRLAEKSAWRVVGCTEGGSPEKVYDGDPATFWMSGISDKNKFITIDLGKAETFTGFRYNPRNDDNTEGTVFRYRLLASDLPEADMKCIAEGEFSNIANNPIAQNIFFKAPVTARYIRFECTEEIEGRDFITIGELSLIQ